MLFLIHKTVDRLPLPIPWVIAPLLLVRIAVWLLPWGLCLTLATNSFLLINIWKGFLWLWSCFFISMKILEISFLENLDLFNKFSTFFYLQIYRVSRNVVAFFALCISRLSKHIGSKCWTFSCSPSNSDFKTILNLKIVQMSTLRRKKR